MKRVFILLALTMGTLVAAQDQSTITVKGSEVNNGVIIVTAAQAATADQEKLSLTLHCNKGVSACKAPDAGAYVMVRLPKNWGMYDCANVDLYPASADPATTQKIGEYCVNEK